MRIIDPIIYFLNHPRLQPKRYRDAMDKLAQIGFHLKYNGASYCILDGWCDIIYCKSLSDVENKIIQLRKVRSKVFCTHHVDDYDFDSHWRQNERY